MAGRVDSSALFAKMGALVYIFKVCRALSRIDSNILHITGY
jgi:hypothetical protein